MAILWYGRRPFDSLVGRVLINLYERLMDTTDSALSGHTLYYYLVTHYGDLITLLKPTWCVELHPIT